MIGVYLIRNKINGMRYVGSSVDIERRFMEHKTPKSNGNNRLHTDIQEIGKENFEFTVLEECTLEDLRDKELQYIRSINPEYNFVGKRRTTEEKKRISDGTKKWWEELPKETRDKIIKNNLKRPKVGHPVSEETRRKISQKVSEVQKVKVSCIETGEIFDSIGDFDKYVGLKKGATTAYLSGRTKSVKGFHVERV